mgnify:CR=1 FL=1
MKYLDELLDLVEKTIHEEIEKAEERFLAIRFNLEGNCKGDKPTNCHIHPKYCYYASKEKDILETMLDVLQKQKNPKCISKQLQEILEYTKMYQSFCLFL